MPSTLIIPASQRPRAAAQTWALLIGIDDYRQPGFQRLRGCKNDAQLMANLLQQQFALPRGHCRLLLDEDATRDAILDALRELAEGAAAGDLLVVYYAGHGSRMRDREGTKPTGWDETLVPFDSGRAPATNRDITDDELRLWLLSLESREVFVTLILDCCHAGGIPRGGPTASTSRGGPEDPRPVDELPASPISVRQRAGLSSAAAVIDLLPRSDRFVVLSACRDDEKAQEYVSPGTSGTTHGAFTYFLSQALTTAAAGGLPETYAEIFGVVAHRVTAAFPRQHPRIEGQIDRVAFGTEVRPRARGVAVVAQNGEELVLHAGEIHGIELGSQWEIQERTTPQRPDGAGSVTAEVFQVAAGVAHARLTQPTPPLHLPCRATARATEGNSPRWAVRCEPGLAELDRLLRESPWLRPGEPAATAPLVVRSQPEGAKLRIDVEVAPAARWNFTLVEGATPELFLTLRERLEAVVRAARLRAIGNRSSTLGQQIECRLIALGARQEWRSLPPSSEGGFVGVEGDRVGLEVRSRSSTPLYFAVLLLSSDGAISPLYPPLGAPAQELAPRCSLRIGAWRVGLCRPSTQGASLLAAGAPPRVEHDLLKVFITTSEIDLRPLLATGRRGRRPQLSHPLAQQVLRAATLQRSRSETASGAQCDWATLDLDLMIQARV